MTQIQSKPLLEQNRSLTAIKLLSQQYFLSLWDASTGGFRFAPHQPATLMATGYCILGLELVQGLSSISAMGKEAIVNFLMMGVQPDGSFKDKLFRPEDITGKSQGLAYFSEETTTFCQQALDALGSPPPQMRLYGDKRNTVEGIVQYCGSLSWENAWLDSNPVMFALSQLCHDAERYQKPELLDVVDVALDWLDDRQSSNTGLWEGPHEVSLVNAMAATFHFTFFYGYRNRPMKRMERIIDSCLKLQESHGLFSGNAVGHTCLDYDAIELLAIASSATNYRFPEVEESMSKAYDALLKLRNSDGGFAHCKERIQHLSGRKARLLRKLRFGKLMSLSTNIAEEKAYSVCWKLLSCESSQSNAFSTWFRLVSLCLIEQNLQSKSDLDKVFKFRRLPFLGYHRSSPSALAGNQISGDAQ